MTHYNHTLAYAEGRNAFVEGERRQHNPYSALDTKQEETIAWWQGFDFEQMESFDPIALELGDEQYFEFNDEYHHDWLRIKYYYRAPDNRLFMTVADTLDLARVQKEQWEMRRRSHRNKARIRAEERERRE